MNAYFTIANKASDEFTEKRSRFIGTVYPVTSEEEVNALVTNLKKEHHDARHNVYAYVLKDGSCRYSEDGEPQGTAGVPILSVLQKNELKDCLVTVTRYFGGILLGTGGLTRAYTHAAALAIESAEIVMMQECELMELTCDYASYGFVGPLLNAKGILQNSDFGEQVFLQVAIPPENVQDIQNELTENSAGKLQLKQIGKMVLPFPKKKF